MDDLDQIIASSLSEGSETGNETSERGSLSHLTSHVSPAGTAAEPARETPDTGEAAPAVDDTPATPLPFLGNEKFDWNTVPPELLPLAKQLQGDYTRKMQSIAAGSREPGAGSQELDENTVLQFLAQKNPALAAQLYEQQAQALRGQEPGAGSQEPDPWGEYAAQTDDGIYFQDQARKLSQELAQIKQWQAQQEQIQLRNQVKQEFADLESSLGRKLDPEEQRATIELAMKTSYPIGDAYFLANRERIIQTERERVRAEASRIVQAKQQVVAPAAPLNGRSVPGEGGPKSLKEIIAESLAEIG